MNLDLQDKTIFITSASSGIGAAAAQIFSAEGSDLVVSYGKNLVGAEKITKKILANGRRAWLCPLDISDPGSVTEAISHLPAEITRLDALVLCVGLSLHTELADITPIERNSHG